MSSDPAEDYRGRDESLISESFLIVKLDGGKQIRARMLPHNGLSYAASVQEGRKKRTFRGSDWIDISSQIREAYNGTKKKQSD